MIRTLKVKKDKHAEDREFNVEVPTSCSDKVWQDRIQHTSPEDLDAKVNDLALGNWVIKWQDAYRRGRSESPEDWKHGAPVVRGFSKPKVTDEGFEAAGAEMPSQAQIDYLNSIGVDTSALTVDEDEDEDEA